MVLLHCIYIRSLKSSHSERYRDLPLCSSEGGEPDTGKGYQTQRIWIHQRHKTRTCPHVPAVFHTVTPAHLCWYRSAESRAAAFEEFLHQQDKIKVL